MVAPRDAKGGSTTGDPSVEPEEFGFAVAELRGTVLRPELQLEEIPGPGRVAPYSAAIAADVVLDEEELGTGRLILLYDPEGHPDWRGTFRFVTYIRTDIEPDLAIDPLFSQVAWSWLTESLECASALYDAMSGTITRVASEGFGGLADDQPRAELEIRASWTPAGGGIERHTRAWGELLCTAAGLPPVPSTMTHSRSGSR